MSIDLNDNIFVLGNSSNYSTVKVIQMYSSTGNLIRTIDFSNEIIEFSKKLKLISSITIHKEKSTLFAVLSFEDERNEISNSLYIYDLTKFEVTQKYGLENIECNLTHIVVNDDQLLITDSDNDCIHLILFPKTNETKLRIKSFSSKGKDDGQVDLPFGIITQCVDNNTFVWVADSFNNRIQKFSLVKQ